MEELIRSLPTFGGTRTEDVRKWLQDVETIFDQVQLRPSNKFIVAQFSLTTTAATWFRFNKSNILDWSTFQVEIVKAFGLSTVSEICSTLTILPKEKENENNQVDSTNNNQIKAPADLEDKSPHEHEQSYCSPISLIVNDPGLKIQLQCAEVNEYDELEKQCAEVNEYDELEKQCAENEYDELKQQCAEVNDCDELKQQCAEVNQYDEIKQQCAEVNEYDELKQQWAHVVNDCDQLQQEDESFVKSGSVKPDAENVFETVAGSVGDLTAAHSDINTSVPIDAQCLWSDKRRIRKSFIFKKVYTGHNWNLYNESPSEDSTFKTISKESNYLFKDTFRRYFQNGLHKLQFHFRKWRYRKWKYRKWKFR
jgi:hypothetical protein